MAVELQVQVAVVDTEPEHPGNPGILVRAARSSTLTPDEEIELAGIFALAEARVQGLVADAAEDVRTQLQVTQRNLGGSA